GVEGAAGLERAGDLEALRLESQVGVEFGCEHHCAADVRTDAVRRLPDLLDMLGQISGQAAAGSGSAAGSRRGARRMLVSTTPARITAIPMTIGTVMLSRRRAAPQKTAVTGTRKVTPAARTAPRVFIT